MGTIWDNAAGNCCHIQDKLSNTAGEQEEELGEPEGIALLQKLRRTGNGRAGVSEEEEKRKCLRR
jgi:hypothetical protein